jgi:hypothetical protein
MKILLRISPCSNKPAELILLTSVKSAYLTRLKSGKIATMSAYIIAVTLGRDVR